MGSSREQLQSGGNAAFAGKITGKRLPDVVSSGPLCRNAPNRTNHRAEFFRPHAFTKRGAGRFGNALFHQSAAEVVGSGLEACEGTLETELDPGCLDVGYPTVEEEPRQCMNDQIFPKSAAPTCRTALVEARLRMDDAQRNELGKAARFSFNVTKQQNVTDPRN